MSEEPTAETWWSILKEAEDLRQGVREQLAGPTLDRETLDDLTDALRYLNESTAICKKHLGLPM